MNKFVLSLSFFCLASLGSAQVTLFTAGGYIQSSAVPSPLDPVAAGGAGAAGDGVIPTNCTTTATGGAGGNGTVVCPAAAGVPGVAFTTTKGPIHLFQAGAANAPGISATIRPYQDLVTTITSVSGPGVGNIATLAIPLVTPNLAGTASIAWGTDDTTALNTFFAKGGNLYLPGLVFMHSGELYVASNSTVTCLGTTLEAASYTSQYIGAQATSPVSNSTIQGCNIVGVQRGRVDGLVASGIYFGNSSDTWAINNNITNFSQVGYAVTGNNPAISVTSQRNHIQGGSISYVMANGVFITHGDQHSDAVDVNCRWTGDACIENTTYGSAGDTVQVGYFTANGNTGDNVVAGCLLDGSLHSRCINNTWSNVVSFCDEATTDSYSAPYLTQDFDISNEKCINSDSGAGGAPAIGLISVLRGKVQNNRVEGGAYGILQNNYGLLSSSGVAIQGNTVFGVSQSSIELIGNATSFNVSTNTVDANSIAGGPVIAVSNTGGAVTNSQISDNVISNANPGQAYGAIDVSGAINVNGAGNIIGSPAGIWYTSVYIHGGSTLSQVSQAPSNGANVATPPGQEVTATGGTGTNYSYVVQAFAPDNTYTLPTNSANGIITAISSVVGGTLVAPSCTLAVTNGGGTGAAGTFPVTSGVAGPVSMTNVGSGYNVPGGATNATLGGPCSGTVTITSTLTNGAVSGPSTLGLTLPAYNTVTLTGGTIASATYVSDSGGTISGTGTCQLASFNGPGGSGATANLTITVGVPGAISMVSAGSGYTGASTGASFSGTTTGTASCTGIGPTITTTMTFVPGASYYAVRRTACGSSGAPCTANSITAASYSSGGMIASGNTTCPLTAFGGGGSGAAGILTVTGGIAGAITMTAYGSGYTPSMPVMPITASLGSPCSGTPTLIPTISGAAAGTGIIGFIVPPATSLTDTGLTGDLTAAPTIPSAGGYIGSSFLNNDNTYTGWGNPGGSAGNTSLYLGGTRHMICASTGNSCTFAGGNTPSVASSISWGAAALPWLGMYTNNLYTSPTVTTPAGTSGTASCSMGLQGTQKIATCYLNGYVNTGTATTYTFPTAFSTYPFLGIGGATPGMCGTYQPGANLTTLTLPANAAMTPETCTVTAIGQ